MGKWKNDLTIREVIGRIQSHKMLLPAIQRKFVWSEEQIIDLMDSMLRGYPIGTFLVWRTTAGAAKGEYSFYSFIADYHERDACVNPRQSISAFSDNDDIYGVLDGQQRLSSLLIAINGSYAAKLPRKHWDNPDAFPRKYLYFNLLSNSKEGFVADSDDRYEFAFFETAPIHDESQLWFKVPAILEVDLENPFAYVRDSYGDLGYSDEVLYETILNNIARLYSVICKSDDVFSYFEVVTDDMDEVLDIFVRTNSGGTVLSKSDLLFSTIVSSWQEARDEFDELVKKVSNEGFRVDSDFIVRVCLMLLDRNVDLKVRSLDAATIEAIHESWDRISASTIDAFRLLKGFGLNHEYVSSYNAVIPIIYLAYKGADLRGSGREIHKYLAIAQAKQLFSRSSNSTLRAIRAALREEGESEASYRLKQEQFSLSQLDGVSVGLDDFRMSDDDIESLFMLGKGPRAFVVLSLLYPNLKLNEIEFHMDHLHPTAGFDDKNFDCPDISPEDHEKWKETCDSLANLQILEGRANQSKNAEPLVKWVERDNHRAQVKYVPEGASFELADFEEFMVQRKALMKEELKRIFM